MKNIIALTLLVSFLFGCSTLPSYHEMSCVELKKSEKSLQTDYKLNSAAALLGAVADLAEHTTQSTATSTQSNVALEATKRDLREVQAILHQKRCR